MHLAKSPLAPIAVSVSLLILFAVIAGAQTEAVLFSFANDGSNGMSPEGALVFDAAGNLYGTTSSGGREEGCGQNCGTIFELSPSVGGGWAQQVLYEFSPPMAMYRQRAWRLINPAIFTAQLMWAVLTIAAWSSSYLPKPAKRGRRRCSTASPVPPMAANPKAE